MKINVLEGNVNRHERDIIRKMLAVDHNKGHYLTNTPMRGISLVCAVDPIIPADRILVGIITARRKYNDNLGAVTKVVKIRITGLTSHEEVATL